MPVFLAIRKGDTPETNSAAKLAVEWIDEWSDCIFSVLEAKATVVK